MRRFSGFTKPQSGCSVTGLYHRLCGETCLAHKIFHDLWPSTLVIGMVEWDDLGGDVFDVLTQDLLVLEGDLPDVDKHLQPGFTSTLNSRITISMTKGQRNYTRQLHRKYRDLVLTSPRHRYSRCRKCPAKTCTKMNTSWAGNVWDNWASYQ